jgi:hypothetical protein
MPQILRFAVAPLQPGENTEDLGRTLRRQGGVKERKFAGIETTFMA